MGGRGDRRGGGGRGGTGRPMSRQVEVSKAMSWILRHGAEKEGLQLDKQGYVNVEELLSWRKMRALKVTFPELQDIVRSNDKQRFALIPAQETIADPSDPSNYLIRATQGHSIKIASDGLLKPLEGDALPAEVVHGTFYAAWPMILESGALKPMSRTHVHFALAVPGGEQEVVSGMRKDAQVLIWVDCKRAAQHGVKWWMSENGVVLAEGEVPLEAATRVEDRKGALGVIWEGGVVKQEIPKDLLAKGIPRGKHRGAKPKDHNKQKRDQRQKEAAEGTSAGPESIDGQ